MQKEAAILKSYMQEYASNLKDIDITPNVVWKDAGVMSSEIANTRYFDNFQNTLQSDQNNNLSIKVNYFLDYLQLKRKI